MRSVLLRPGGRGGRRREARTGRDWVRPKGPAGTGSVRSWVGGTGSGGVVGLVGTVMVGGVPVGPRADHGPVHGEEGAFLGVAQEVIIADGTFGGRCRLSVGRHVGGVGEEVPHREVQCLRQRLDDANGRLVEPPFYLAEV